MRETDAPGSVMHYIRRSIKRKICFPLLLNIACVILICLMPVRSFLKPVSIDDSQSFESVDLERDKYVTSRADKLYYSGFDYYRNGELEGHFYYSLIDGMCRFYIIKAKVLQTAGSVLSERCVTGQIIEIDAIYDNLTNSVAEEIGWTSEGLKSISTPYVLSEVDYYDIKMIFFLVVVSVSIIISIIAIVRMTIYLIAPKLCVAYRRLSRYGAASKQLEQLEGQLATDSILRTKDLALTKDYLVEFSDYLSAIVPLKAVLWAYERSYFIYVLFRKKQLRYAIHIVMENGDSYVFKGKHKEDVDLIMNELSNRHPDFFIGYSEEHKKMVEHILKENKYDTLKNKLHCNKSDTIKDCKTDNASDEPDLKKDSQKEENGTADETKKDTRLEENKEAQSVFSASEDDL